MAADDNQEEREYNVTVQIGRVKSLTVKADSNSAAAAKAKDDLDLDNGEEVTATRYVIPTDADVPDGVHDPPVKEHDKMIITHLE
jgi:hypothetical protein